MESSLAVPASVQPDVPVIRVFLVDAHEVTGAEWPRFWRPIRTSVWSARPNR